MAISLIMAACGPAHKGSRSGAGDLQQPAAVILHGEDSRNPVPIRNLLTDARPAVRARAALALGRIGEGGDVEALSGLLGDAQPTVRADAAFGLGLIGDVGATPALGRLVSGGAADPVPEVRARAVDALVRIGARETGAILRPLLVEGGGEAARQALQRVWRLQDPELVGPVAVRAEGADASLRAAAAYSLMRMVGPPNTGATPVPGGTPMSVEVRGQVAGVLSRLCVDPDPDVRQLAARGLGGGELPGAEEALLSLLDDPSWQVRVNALRSLGRMPGGFSAEALTVSLRDEQVNVRLAAIEALAALPRSAALTAELDRLRAAPELAVRLGAEQALSAWNGPEYLPRALELSEAPDRRVRAAAAGMLGAIPGGAARARLQNMLTDAAPAVAEAALTALGGREGTDLQALSRSVAGEAEAFTVRAAAVSMMPPDGPGVVTVLQSVWSHALGDAQNDARMAVARRLRAVAGEEADVLARRMVQEDPDWRVRVEAAHVLGARGADPAPRVGPLETGREMPEYEELARRASRQVRVALTLERGTIVLELFSADAPLTVANFVDLVERGYYDGLTFHRVVPNFVIQGGDPRGDGWGGPGYQIRCEINARPYRRGTVGMALDGKDTGGSQFFITQSPQPHLDGGYTVFGQVVQGMDVVDRVVQGDVILSARVLR